MWLLKVIFPNLFSSFFNFSPMASAIQAQSKKIKARTRSQVRALMVGINLTAVFLD
jgi:hypothetical protein